MNFKFHKFSSVIGRIPLLANPLERSSTVLTYSNAAGIQGALVLGRRVLVESDVAEFTNAFESRPVQTFAFQVNQHQMIVRATF